MKRWGAGRRRAVRFGALVSSSFLLASTASAYYYYVYFNTSAPPYSPVVARFDLSALVNKTVPFFVSGAGPSVMYPGDSLQAIASQITAAANVWNGVSTSSIRLAYGGFYSAGTTEAAPGIQIEFSDDIPPGLLALSAPTVFGNLVTESNSTFIPVYLSLMELPSDLTTFNGPSYSEQFFVTLVHEFGHTLGLQHTLTSSVMSTLNTSASTKANPLGPDDIAGISLLYPAGKYLSKVGSIAGTVSMNGNGLNLASVVAISPSNPAISTLTNPDGTYQINGVPPGYYFVYAHPLPRPVEGQSSPANVFFPHNSNGVFLAPNTGFAAEFYPNTQSALQAQVIPVTAGNVSQGIDFNVNPTSWPGISSVRTYGYIQNTYVQGAPILLDEKTTIAATGVGLLQSDNILAPGLSVGMLGTAAQIDNLRAYPPPNAFIAVDALVTFTAGAGPKHLLFSTPNDLYVLPAGFSVVDAPPPLISALGPAVDGNGIAAIAIAGQHFTASTQILFDGLPAVIQSQSSNLLVVTPPPGPVGYTAAVAALNSDGQSSLFLNPTAPTYTYATGAASTVAANPSLVVSPSVIPAGGDVTVDVQGVNTNFTQDLTTVGFGTSDVLVKQITVISPTHLTVTVTPNVTISSASITVTTGLDAIAQALGSQITATDPQQ
ncbi:MAG: matrixin family metalloprotease [Bryobacterales bacterium]|nr:matrixin family metalloprotease [Bryobacterales bacterium]